MDYKKSIIELVEQINNEVLLSFLYDLVNAFQKKWGI